MAIVPKQERRVRIFDSGRSFTLLHCESLGTPQQFRREITGFVHTDEGPDRRRDGPLTPPSNAVTLTFVHAP
jgi:hypothetical protein